MHTLNMRGFLALIAMVGLSFGTGDARASAVRTTMDYSTSGSVGSRGITGSPLVSFRPVDTGSLVTGEEFTLGEFIVAAPPEGSSTRYYGTPFEIRLTANQVDGVATPPGQATTVLNGSISGLVDGPELEPLIIGIDVGPQPLDPKYYNPIYPTFQIGSQQYRLTHQGTFFLPIPGESGESRVSVRGKIEPVPVPEPMTSSLFVLLALGLSTHYYHKRTGQR